MARPRGGLRARPSIGMDSDANADDELARPTRTRSSKRLSQAAESARSAPSTPASADNASAKKPRGRPRKTTTLAQQSVPSTSTSASVADTASPGDYSTPATSIETTPAPTTTAESTKTAAPVTSSTNIEVQLPRQPPAATERASRNGKYSMNPRSKKKGKMLDLSDSDSDDAPPGISHDEMVARRLQEEEYSKMEQPVLYGTSRKRGRQSPPVAGPSTQASKKAKIVPPSDDDNDDEVYPEDDAHIMDLGVPPSSDSENLSFIDDSEDDDDEFDDGSSDDEPLSKKKGKGKGKGKAPSKAAPRRPRRPAAAAPPAASGESDPADPSATVGNDTSSALSDIYTSDATTSDAGATTHTPRRRPQSGGPFKSRRSRLERMRLEENHPEIKTMWTDLANMPVIDAGKAVQPTNISRQLKPFQLEGLAWMKEMEKQEWKGGLLGDEMGLGKTIQAVSLIMSDWPAKKPTLVLVPPVALMQWTSEIASYTDGTLKTFVFHGTNAQSKSMTLKQLKQYDVIMMSYNSLESMYRKQEKGFKRKNGLHKEESLIHQIQFHRIILDEAHCIKTRTTMTAKACFALKVDYRWCLTGTPLQNRIGEFFSLIRFLNVSPFASYLCKQCDCSSLEWHMDDDSRCSGCGHAGMQHVSVFNQELLNPIQKFGNLGPGAEAFRKLRLMTDRIMLRRLKKDHTSSMDLPVKEITVDRQFFGEVENDFANSIMTNSQRKFETYVAQGVMLNNYANIFGLIMQMRQVADHPDLILKKKAEGGQNILVCCICDEPAEDAIQSRCKHDFCRGCAKGYLASSDEPDCPHCHIPLSIDLEQPEVEQDESLVKKSSIINRIKMENWTSSSKIELLVRDIHRLRSDNSSHKSIIFSQFTSMLQLIEWRLRRVGVTTVMLDGTMTPAQRQASIEHFMKNPEVECFLVSLKAGGVALNLTEASHVFIVDPWWNPAAEWQSADRCHRIGQTRPCFITRLCIEDSVESRMVLIQEKKTNMIHSTVNGDNKAMDSLSPQDMQFLFRGS